MRSLIPLQYNFTGYLRLLCKFECLLWTLLPHSTSCKRVESFFKLVISSYYYIYNALTQKNFIHHIFFTQNILVDVTHFVVACVHSVNTIWEPGARQPQHSIPMSWSRQNRADEYSGRVHHEVHTTTQKLPIKIMTGHLHSSTTKPTYD